MITKKLLLLAGVAIAVCNGLVGIGNLPVIQLVEAEGSSDQIIAHAFEEHASGLQIEGEGIVTKILPDDVDGNRHQRFIIRLDSGQTLLVAHNIDIAPKLSTLEVGDKIAFKGEYEWNDKGGVLHWTHHDPEGHHTGGWLKLNGQTYE